MPKSGEIKMNQNLNMRFKNRITTMHRVLLEKHCLATFARIKPFFEMIPILISERLERNGIGKRKKWKTK